MCGSASYGNGCTHPPGAWSAAPTRFQPPRDDGHPAVTARSAALARALRAKSPALHPYSNRIVAIWITGPYTPLDRRGDAGGRHCGQSSFLTRALAAQVDNQLEHDVDGRERSRSARLASFAELSAASSLSADRRRRRAAARERVPERNADRGPTRSQRRRLARRHRPHHPGRLRGIRMTFELLVSTRKGLVIGRSEDRQRWEFSDTHFMGWQIDYAVRDPRNGRHPRRREPHAVGPAHPPFRRRRRHLAGSSSPGVPRRDLQLLRLGSGDGLAAATEEPTKLRSSVSGPSSPAQPPCRVILYAGIDPAALFVSNQRRRFVGADAAHSGSTSTRPMWVPGAAGMTLHHVAIAEDDPQHLYVGISSAGVFESLDGGATWAARNKGCIAEHLPGGRAGGRASVCTRYTSTRRTAIACSSSTTPASTAPMTAAHSGSPIHEGLPGEFGFASTIDPANPDAFYVIPLQFDQARVPADGDLRVYRTRDAGTSWEPLGDGLPDGHVLQGVYRQALTNDGVTELRPVWVSTSEPAAGTCTRRTTAASNGPRSWTTWRRSRRSAAPRSASSIKRVGRPASDLPLHEHRHDDVHEGVVAHRADHPGA